MNDNRGGESLPALDLAAEREDVARQLASTGEMDALTSRIDVYDMNSILSFGKEAAERVAGASDEVLRDMARPRGDDSGALMRALANVMERLDSDGTGEKPALLGRLFGRSRDRLDGELERYHALGGELDRVYAGLRAYERELRRDNRQLETLLRANVGYYRELEKYVLAGEQGCREIGDYIAQRQAAPDATGDGAIAFELQTLNHALAALRRRVSDLRTAEAVALQSIPMLRSLQLNNLALADQISTAFIVTLPVFRQALSGAVQEKRRRLRDEALSALENRDNAGGAASGGQADLETARRTIKEGIGEARRLEASAREQRERDRARLEKIRQDYAARDVGERRP